MFNVVSREMLIKVTITPFHTRLLREKFQKNLLMYQNVGAFRGLGDTQALLVGAQADVASSESSRTARSKACV